MEYTYITHPFEPVYNEQSEILILGSLPSVKSREQGFYYGHPQNRFWKVLTEISRMKQEADFVTPQQEVILENQHKEATEKENPRMKIQVLQTIEEKKRFLLENHIAIWDVIASCEIKGSSDSSIKHAVANDIAGLLERSQIQRIYANGKTAGHLYMQHVYPVTGREITILPSTSPANAVWTLEKLVEVWGGTIYD